MFSTDLFSTRDALFEALDGAIVASHEAESEAWRLRSLRRCLAALETRSTAADRGALLRNAAWLLDNGIDLPRAGWSLELETLSVSTLRRFGVTLTVTDPQRWIVRLLDEGREQAEWPIGVVQASGLDLSPRRLTSLASPDGALLRLSPHHAYRLPTQKAAARAEMTMPEGATLVVSMPTGGGKSLLFQLGALWWRERDRVNPACVVVIVPTVALALDHAETFKRLPGLERSRALTADVPQEEKRQVLQDFLRGEIPILVMNPETAFRSALETLERVCQSRTERLGDAKAELAAIFIDEAHIIESWGRSFRPDFQQLAPLITRLRETNPALRTILLSATVTDTARELLRRDYRRSGEWLEVDAGVPRYELELFARRYDTTQVRDRVLFDLLDRLPRPAVVYTTAIEAATELLDKLRARGYGAVESFTGETGPDERKRILVAWQSDKLDLVVANAAFGLGIDKANVRAVLHTCLPEDASRYYQEVGRAGRDGHRALGICLWTDDDAQTARSMRAKEWLQIDTAIERWRRIADLCQENQALDIDSRTGKRRLSIDVNIAVERLGSKTGGRNREWNRTLLTLMQRARAIRVLDVDETTDTWTVEVLDPRILDGDEAFLTDVFSLREDERQQANEAFGEFLEVIQGPFCLLAETFRLVESGRPFVAECGRCGPCLEQGTSSPDTVTFFGLDAQWNHPQLPTKPWVMPGTVLVEHDELDLSALLAAQAPHLSGIGVLQFVVPDRQVAEAAKALSTVMKHPGLVMGFEERVVHGWQLYDVPTTAVLDSEAPNVFQKAFLREHLSRPREQRPPLIIFARDRYLLDERLLNQYVDTTYSLSQLETIIATRRTTRESA